MRHFSIKQHFEQMCQFALLPTFARKGSYRQKSSNISIKTSQEYMKNIENVAKKKMCDMNASSIEAAIQMVRGSAISMGLEVVE